MTRKCACEWGDSNPHDVTHWYLNSVRSDEDTAKLLAGFGDSTVNSGGCARQICKQQTRETTSMSEIVNLTPHAITIPNLPVSGMEELADWTLAPSGSIARAAEVVTPATPIGDIPTSRITYGVVENLPPPQWNALPSPCDAPGAIPEGSRFCLVCGAQDGHHPAPREVAVYYVVSSLAAEAARRSGRTTEDLLMPGQQVRDDAGRIVGCRSLARVG